MFGIYVTEVQLLVEGKEDFICGHMRRGGMERGREEEGGKRREGGIERGREEEREGLREEGMKRGRDEEREREEEGGKRNEGQIERGREEGGKRREGGKRFLPFPTSGATLSASGQGSSVNQRSDSLLNSTS